MKKSDFYKIIKQAYHRVNICFAKLQKRMLVNNSKYETLKKEAIDHPTSNGCRFYNRSSVKVGIIADEFIYESYKPTCHLVYISNDNWKDNIDKIECLIVTSLWRGLNNEWIKAYEIGTETNKLIHEIISCARSKNIKVIFYSKEDPPNFEHFIDIAKHCDYIFTSAEECIPKYIEKTENKNCFALPFGFNPLLYNPIGMNQKIHKNTVLFAGSWMKKYPYRIKSQKMLFDIVLKNGLDLRIIDRNYYIYNTRYTYPLKYLNRIVPSFAYKELSALYKLHDYVLNLNSVTDSNTMFAARICDASACGAIIISNDSIGMRKNYPNVKVINNEADFKKLTEQGSKYESRCDSVRTAFRNGTTFDRLNFIFQKCNIISDSLCRSRVAVIALADEKNRSDILRMFDAQTYKDKHLLFSCNDIEISDYDYISLWSDAFSYGKHYLEDCINCFKFTDSDFVTCSDMENAHNYTSFYTDKYLTVFSTRGEYSNVSDILSRTDMFGYSIDSNNINNGGE